MFVLLSGLFQPEAGARASRPAAPLAQSEVTAFDLIIAMNTLRVSYGLSALVEDPIIDAVAQATAEIMAANQMSWHIGDVAGRLSSAGYGGGVKVWGTENFAVGNMSIDEIMLVWSDASHMIPAVNPAYCNVGAGVAKSANGLTYYVLQAAYTVNKSCGEYKSPEGSVTNPGGSTNEGRVGAGYGLIVPVKVATPDAEGKIYHVVESGQSFWSIAVAYKITIKDIETWNNLSKDTKLQIGQRLFIPSSNTAGYATPTPVGMVIASTPNPDGKIVHVVAPYQTLSTIAQAYKMTVDTLLLLNGLKIDWPLQISQKLLIQPSQITPSPTPKPLSAVEKLTPESDGKYYHTISSGETLSWIAALYEIPLADLMDWNDLNDASIIQPNQKLVLQVTPPATVTPTPAPPTVTPTSSATASAAPLTATLAPSATLPGPSESETPGAPAAGLAPQALLGFVLVGLGLCAIFLIAFFSRKK